MDNSIFPDCRALSNATSLHFFFKNEDYDNDGVPVGPLYVANDQGENARSRRYVTITEAKQIARGFNSELVED